MTTPELEVRIVRQVELASGRLGLTIAYRPAGTTPWQKLTVYYWPDLERDTTEARAQEVAADDYAQRHA